MYSFVYSTKFKKDNKLCQKRNYDFQEFKAVIETLEKTGKLPVKYKPNTLSGNFKNHWEYHIRPDWLLIWLQDDDLKELILIRTGPHSDFFKIIPIALECPKRLKFPA